MKRAVKVFHGLFLFIMFKSYRILVSAFFGLVVFLFWFLCFPRTLQFYEQNQLFLFTWDYLVNRIAEYGGVANYFAEFLTQFFYWPWLGALIIALLLVVLQVVCAFLADGKYYAASVLPSASFLVLMGDHDVMLCYLVGLILSSLLSLIYKKYPSRIFAIIAIPVALWIFGPAALVFVAYVIFKDRKWQSVLYALYALAILITFSCTMLRQYPWHQVLYGVNYYFAPLKQPAFFMVPLLLTALTPILASITSSSKNPFFSEAITIAVIAVATAIGVFFSFEKNVHTILAYDQLVRFEKWDDIVKKAEKNQPENSLSAVCVNLALCMTGKMDEMNDFYQCGTRGLIMPNVRDNISNSSSCEVFWRLGMINESLRYAFDTQESIMLHNKSGRWMKRMAECQILNGRYDVAKKYLDILSHSLVYHKWAKDANRFLYNSQAILNEPLYAYLLSIRFQDDFLFYYPELGKILYKLYLQNNNNYLAGWYVKSWMELEASNQIDEKDTGSSSHGS